MPPKGDTLSDKVDDLWNDYPSGCVMYYFEMMFEAHSPFAL